MKIQNHNSNFASQEQLKVKLDSPYKLVLTVSKEWAVTIHIGDGNG